MWEEEGEEGGEEEDDEEKEEEEKKEEEEEVRYSLYVLRVGWIGGSREGKGGKEEEEPKGFGRKVYPRDQYIECLKKESLKHKRRVKIGDKKIRRVRRGREQRDRI